MEQIVKNSTKVFFFPNRITNSLKHIWHYPMTVVEAPMGYGKSTSVRAYLNHSNATVLWQRVFDNSETSFWLKFCKLIEVHDKNCAHHLEKLGLPNDMRFNEEALQLIQDAELPSDLVWVIDDYHLMESESVNAFITYLVQNEVDGFRIVVTARYLELNSLEELKLKGYLLYIGKDTFEFQTADIQKYFKECGVALKQHEAESLFKFSEGWISALYLLMLNYGSEYNTTAASNIYKLVEQVVYTPCTDEVKTFLLYLCCFDSFTFEQANQVWQKENTASLLDSITNQNGFVVYDELNKIYVVHNIFSYCLRNIFKAQETNFQKMVYKRLAHCSLTHNDYYKAMYYEALAEDYEALMSVIELDRGHSIFNEHKETFIGYFESCPIDIKYRHPVALLIYALCLFSFNEMSLFEKTCNEFMEAVHGNESLEQSQINQLMGEFELLMNFTEYNDINKMLGRVKAAWELLEKPVEFIDTKGGWTFGSPSVLYMFYRESGQLSQNTEALELAIPFYEKLTSGHGGGADLVMAGERHYLQGDLVNAEIYANKALSYSSKNNQTEIYICGLFLMARIELIKGDYTKLKALCKETSDLVQLSHGYDLLHTVDLCEGYIGGILERIDGIPTWILEGNFESSYLYFPTLAFSNIVYGKILLVKEEYLKLLGLSDYFHEIASVFPNQLGQLYTYIYEAIANYRIFRESEAKSALEQALVIGEADGLVMPFIENYRLLESLFENIALNETYLFFANQIVTSAKENYSHINAIINEDLTPAKPQLTERELEIVCLVSEGLTNQEIGERLYISVNTVKTQLKTIFTKLDVSSRIMVKVYYSEYISGKTN